MGIDEMLPLLPLAKNGRSSSPTVFQQGATPATNGQPDMAYVTAVWQQRAAELAKPPQIEPEGTTLDLLTFVLNGEHYGVQVQHVREIYPLRQVTPVPRTPEFVVGVFSARGKLLSVIDLHAFLGLPKIERGKNSKIIVVTSQCQDSSGQFEIGLLADEAEDVLTIYKDDLTPMISGQKEERAEYTLGVTPEMLVVLDLAALLQNKRLIVYEEI